MYGIYLKCERCGKTIGGEQVTAGKGHVPPLDRYEGTSLRQMAAERGWTHTPPDSDYCPECAPQERTAMERPQEPDEDLPWVIALLNADRLWGTPATAEPIDARLRADGDSTLGTE